MKLLVGFSFIFLLVNGVFTKPKFYCEFGICQADQYCCKDNTCCDKPLDFGYLWIGLIIVIGVVLFFIFLRIYLNRKKTTNERINYQYSRLSQA